MKSLSFYVMLSITTLGTACGLSGVFDSDNSPRKNALEQTAEQVLAVHITGGIAGVNRVLTIDSEAHAIYTDNFLNNSRWDVKLDEATFSSIAPLLIDNHFFGLDDRYIDPQVADAFFYEITFTSDGQTKTVTTDNMRVPEDLEDIVTGIHALIEKVKQMGPGLTLSLNKNAMRVGDSLEMTLDVKNHSDSAITLHFNDGQIFDFQVFRGDGGDLVWNWAQDKGFIQVLVDITLEAGEARSYTETWDGKNNAGQAVIGDFDVVGVLSAEPVGMTQPVLLKITE